MNTHTEYRRHSHHPSAQQPRIVEPGAASELARHRDPSLPGGPPVRGTSPKRVAWVRPTELGAYVGPLVGRGIDLHADLVRRVRQAPAAAVRAVRNPVPVEGARRGVSREGLGL